MGTAPWAWGRDSEAEGAGPSSRLPHCICSCFANLGAPKHLSTPGAYRRAVATQVARPTPESLHF